MLPKLANYLNHIIATKYSAPHNHNITDVDLELTNSIVPGSPLGSGNIVLVASSSLKITLFGKPAYYTITIDDCKGNYALQLRTQQHGLDNISLASELFHVCHPHMLNEHNIPDPTAYGRHWFTKLFFEIHSVHNNTMFDILHSPHYNKFKIHLTEMYYDPTYFEPPAATQPHAAPMELTLPQPNSPKEIAEQFQHVITKYTKVISL